MREPLRLTGFARGTHVEVIPSIRDVVASSGGSILDCHLFSNAIVTVNFEIDSDALEALGTSLPQSRVTLDRASVTELEEAAAAWTGPLEASLSVNLIHDDPDLRIEVPAVPG